MNTINFINPQQSSITYQTMVFPDGQPHLKIDTNTINHTSEQATIYTRIANPTDLLLVLMAKDLLYTLGLRRFSLHISYLMAARMDRSMTNGESFSLRVVAQLLNTAGFESIQVFDPHSDVAPALLQHGQAISNVGFAQTAIHHYRQQNPGLQHGQLCLVSPDAGALKKVLKLAAALGGMYVVECLKERDVNTGQLLGFKVFDENLAGKTCLIVDDICDGGGTFIGTAALLKAKGAAAVVLVVSHGIFSKGLPLAQVDAVYCTNSYRALASGQGLTVLEVMNYLG